MDILRNDSTENSSVENVLTAHLDNVKDLSNILKAIHFKNKAIVFLSENGLKVIVEDAKCMQGSAYIPSTIFQHFSFSSCEDVLIQIPFMALMQCLTIFEGCSSTTGVTTALKMTYKGYGFPLNLILEEEGIITDCQVKTYESSEILDFAMPPELTVTKVIMRAPELKIIFAELDSTSEFVEFKFSPEPEHLKIITRGECGNCEVCISSLSNCVETFVCEQDLKFQYTYVQMKPVLKPLTFAIKVNIRTTVEGLLCFHFMVPTESKQLCYMEYFCTPVTEDD